MLKIGLNFTHACLVNTTKTNKDKTLLEFLRGRSPRRTNPRTLQHLAWFDHVHHLSGLSLNTLAAKCIDQFTRSGLVYKWKTGETLARLSSVKRLGKDFPESLETYGLPLYQLLENRRLGRVQIKNLMRIYQGIDGSMLSYAFPNDEELRAQGRFVPTMAREDSMSLLARGDIYGFTAIVALVREAEALGDVRMHWIHAANMYRALPAVGRLPWFRRNMPLLRECVEVIHCRGSAPDEYLEFDVAWDVIEKQIAAPTHETIRERRPRDPVTRRFVDLEDPIRYRGLHRPKTIPRWTS